MQSPEKMAPSIGTSRHDVPSDETQIAGAFLSLLKITDPVATSRPAPAATLVMEICGVCPSRPRETSAGTGGTSAASHVSPSEEYQALLNEPTATTPGPPAVTPPIESRPSSG